jgi:hypothetical protein
MGIGSQAGAWEPAEQINQFSVKIERYVRPIADYLEYFPLFIIFTESLHNFSTIGC